MYNPNFCFFCPFYRMKLGSLKPYFLVKLLSLTQNKENFQKKDQFEQTYVPSTISNFIM